MQAVPPRVPVRGIPRVGGIIEDGHAHGLPVHRSAVVHPRRAFSPDVLLGFLAFGVHHGAAALLFGHGRRQADAESAFLGVAECELLQRFDQHLVIDGPQVWIRVEGDGAGVGHDRFAGGVQAFEYSLDGAGLFPALGFHHLLQLHAALPQTGARALLGDGRGRPLSRLGLPEIDAVDVAVREKQAAMVRVILSLAGELLHRKVPRDHRARGGAQRPYIRFVAAGGEVKGGVRLAIDLDQDPVGRGLCDFDLGAEWQRQNERREQCQSHYRGVSLGTT